MSYILSRCRGPALERSAPCVRVSPAPAAVRAKRSTIGSKCVDVRCAAGG